MSNKKTLQGKIIRVSELKKHTSKKTGKEFIFKKFILDVGTPNKPNPVSFQVSGKYLSIIYPEMTGCIVSVDFYINGIATKSGYWNTLNAVVIDGVGGKHRNQGIYNDKI